MGLKLRALPLHMRHRYCGTREVTRFLGTRRGMSRMGCTKLPSSGCCTLTRGCVGRNEAYNIVSFRLANNQRTTIHFVSDLGLTAVTARMTTSGAVVLRPTDRARHRVGSRRLTRTNMSPKVVHLSINVRGIRSVVTSVRRTLGGTWGVVSGGPGRLLG